MEPNENDGEDKSAGATVSALIAAYEAMSDEQKEAINRESAANEKRLREYHMSVLGGQVNTYLTESVSPIMASIMETQRIMGPISALTAARESFAGSEVVAGIKAAYSFQNSDLARSIREMSSFHNSDLSHAIQNMTAFHRSDLGRAIESITSFNRNYVGVTDSFSKALALTTRSLHLSEFSGMFRPYQESLPTFENLVGKKLVEGLFPILQEGVLSATRLMEQQYARSLVESLFPSETDRFTPATLSAIADLVEESLDEIEPLEHTQDDIAFAEVKRIQFLNARLDELINDVLLKPELRYDLHWRDFEKLYANIFDRLGYKITLGSGSHDKGLDIIAEKADDFQMVVGIQCKRYAKGNTVDPNDVYALFGVVLGRKMNKGILATTSTFGPDSYQFAKEQNWFVGLDDGEDFVKRLRMLRQ